MAVILEGAIHRYIGRAADAKPTPGGLSSDGVTVLTVKDVPPGSTYKDEYGRISTWNGADWIMPPEATQDALLQAIDLLRVEIAQLRLGMIEAGTANEVSADDALAVIAA